MNQVLYLKTGETILTTEKENAYTVIKGTVRVYMVPDKNGELGRRALLTTVKENHGIPSLNFTDMDYRNWKFMIVAVDDAELMVLEGGTTGPLKKKFSFICDISNYDLEGFEEGFVDKYNMILAREDAFFIKTKKEKDAVLKRTDRLVESVCNPNIEEIEYGENVNLLYSTVALLCERTGIHIETFDKICEYSGENISIRDIARVSHFSVREVILEKGWNKKDIGPIVTYTDEGDPIAFVPRGQSGYGYVRNGIYHKRIPKDVAEKINPRAYMLYRPLPEKSLSWSDVVSFSLKSLNRTDIASMIILSVLVTLISLIIPSLTQRVYDAYIPAKSDSRIVLGGIIAFAFMISALMFSLVKSINAMRLNSHLKYDLQNAIYQRVYEFPENFFRQYESADLGMRVSLFGDCAQSLIMMIFTLVIAVVNSIIYTVKMLSYSAFLSLLGVAVVVIVCCMNILISRLSLRYENGISQLSSQASSKLYQFVSGIDKIRMAGVEDRAVYEYLSPLAKKRKADIDRGSLRDIQNLMAVLLDGLVPVISYIFLYYRANELSTGNYVAFISAFGLATSAIMSLGDIVTSFVILKPTLERIRPLLEQIPETTNNKISPGKLSGEIDIDHVSFAYGENEPEVIKNISLHISEGEYVGIVGSSGCGKSTLIKLLLGFEYPTSGKIYYDDQSTDMIDLQQFRRQLGVVLQNGQLIAGSIYENITITSPEATMDQVKQAVKMVNLSRDISEMPMGFHTILSENAETISGGQKQRILIARAIISNPKIILMDEATSALDNISQAQVCSALEKMNCTRIVIAHRLSTIKDCDRIIVLDEGRIAEQGTFDELYAKKGLFYLLASRQMA